MHLFDLTAERERLALAPDCASCFGLCCVAHGFRASASFAYDKAPGKPCRNLLDDFGCTIYGTLRQHGFSGCTAYTCFGAGQKVAQRMFGGTDWRQAPETAELMFQTLPIMRQLNELLWFVTEALDRCPAGGRYQQLLGLLDETERLTAARADEMSWGDVDQHCRSGEKLLGQVSGAIRTAALSAVREPTHRTVLRSADSRGADLHGADLRGADLRGADLRGADLRGADLRGVDLQGVDLWGAMLSDADLSGADLRWADLMGADLGRANLADADLSAAIFLTQGQLQLAHGNAGTTLSGPLQPPAHWAMADRNPGPTPALPETHSQTIPGQTQSPTNPAQT